MKRVVALLTFLVLMFAFCSIALAAGGAQLYDRYPINHRVDFGPLAKGTAPYWTGGSDNNTYVQFDNPNLTKYQQSRVVTDNGIAMSDQREVSSGESRSFSIYSAYRNEAHANLRVWNPYYGTSSASPMHTKGDFSMTF